MSASRTGLLVERLMPGSPDAVFAAWTDPDLLHDWMAPEGYAEATLDVREGGTFTIVMVGEGMTIEHTGEYLVVDPPRRLSFTWASPYTDGPSVVDVRFEPRGDGTLVRIEHSKLPAERVEGHEGGWGTILDRLAKVLAR